MLICSMCPAHASLHVHMGHVHQSHGPFTSHAQVTPEVLIRYLELEANIFFKLVWGIQGMWLGQLCVTSSGSSRQVME